MCTILYSAFFYCQLSFEERSGILEGDRKTGLRKLCHSSWGKKKGGNVLIEWVSSFLKTGVTFTLDFLNQRCEPNHLGLEKGMECNQTQICE